MGYTRFSLVTGTLWAVGTCLGMLPALAQDSGTDPEGHRTSDFTDTRLTVTFGDEDVLSPTAEALPLSPRAGFGDREGYSLFYDNLNSRFSSRESLAHLVLHREMPGFAEGIRTEAALVVRLSMLDASLRDSGSYLRLIYAPWAEAPADAVSFTAFPFDSERFRLGHLWDLSYAGTEHLTDGPFLRAPGLKIQLDRLGGSYFIGLKTSLAHEPIVIDTVPGSGVSVGVEETQYAALLGAGWEFFAERLRLDLGAGIFQQGTLNEAGYGRDSLYTVAGSARVTWHQDVAVLEPIDARLYRNDPNAPLSFLREVSYVPGHLSYLVSAEGTFLRQRLADTDALGSTTYEPAWAAAVQGRLEYDYFRLELTGVARTASFLLREGPGVVPFLSTPDAANPKPNLFIALTADYHFPSPQLTLAASVGVDGPATFRTVAAGGFATEQSVVVRGNGQTDLLPVGRERNAIWAARLSARMDFSEMLYAQLWSQYVRDANRSQLVQSDGRLVTPKRNQLGFGLTMAARF